MRSFLTESRFNLFSVLKDSLWCSEASKELLDSLDEQRVLELLEESQRQTVHGLVFDRLSYHNFPFAKTFVFEHAGIIAQTAAQNCHMNEVLAEFARVMKSQSIGYVVVKGQSIASLYPKPDLRQSGDVDFYCCPSQFRKAVEVLPDVLGIEFRGHDSNRHLTFEWRGVSFEMHFALFDFYNRKKNRMWSELLNNSEKDTFVLNACEVRTLHATLHAFYVFLHIFEHLIELGVGLRQFCDFAMILHRQHDVIDFEKFRSYCKEFGMTKAMKACGYILVNYLGLQASAFPYQLTEKDSERADRILEVVFYRGNMGKYNKLSGFSGWRHNFEATGIKIAHFLKFAPLSYGFSTRWICCEIPRKLALKSKKALTRKSKP